MDLKYLGQCSRNNPRREIIILEDKKKDEKKIPFDVIQNGKKATKEVTVI